MSVHALILYALFFVSKGKDLKNFEISNLLSMPISVLWAVLKLSRNYLHYGCSFEHLMASGIMWCPVMDEVLYNHCITTRTYHV